MVTHFLIYALCLISVNSIIAQELTGSQIIDKVNELMNQQTMQAEALMTIVTTSGQTRTFKYTSYSKDDGEKNLVVYTSPNRVKGQKILMLNNADDIWAYFPRTGRVRKLATHAKKQKMQGSDFSYEDMGSGNSFITDYESKRLKDEKIEGFDCYKIEMTRKKDSDASYSRLMLWVIKENFLPVVIDYYDENNPNRLLKRMVQSDIRMIDGVPTGMKIVMYNKQDNTQTSMEFVSVQYNVKLDDKIFTEGGLRR